MPEPPVNRRPPVDYIERTRRQYSALGYPPYRWVESATPPPWTAVDKPLSESRLALLASGGIYVAGQVAFHWKDDISYRDVDTSTETSELRATHFAYDLTDARSDPNVVFPLDTLRGLVAEGVLGGLGRNAYTFMGGIYSSRRVEERLAPALTQRLLADEVDLALLVPV
jgi:D-proline reductase (dithiol) PrdB